MEKLARGNAVILIKKLGMTALSRPVSSRRDSKEILAKKPTEHETNHHLYVASFVCISGAGFLSSMARWGIDAWEAQAGKTLPKQASQRPALKTFYATGSKESQKKKRRDHPKTILKDPSEFACLKKAHALSATRRNEATLQVSQQDPNATPGDKTPVVISANALLETRPRLILRTKGSQLNQCFDFKTHCTWHLYRMVSSCFSLSDQIFNIQSKTNLW